MYQRFAAIALVLLFTGISIADETAKELSPEEKAVHRACMDYVEGVYDVKPEFIERSVHKDLKKFGYWRQPGQGEYRASPMTYQQLYDLSKTYNSSGRIPKDAPKEVTVFDVLDKTASAKLVAHWGIDYFHLVKEDGKWKILQVVWQSAPEKQDE